MRVTDEHHAVAAVHVDVLVAVDVVHLRAFAVAQPDGLRCRDLPARRGAAGEHLAPAPDELTAARLAGEEGLFLGGDQLLQAGGGGGVDDWRGPRGGTPVTGTPR